MPPSPANTLPTAHIEPLISVRDLRHTFGAGAAAREVLHGLDVDIAPGEIVIVMGHSGSGKTTFLTLVSALRAVQSGRVRLAGRDLDRASPAELTAARRSIGFIFQRHHLIASLSARQNVQMALLLDGNAAAKNSAAPAEALLAQVGLAGHEHKRPHELSVGQQQRVAIARALGRRPRVIMADEPTASLDAQSGREIVDLLQSLARRDGCTVVIVTHDARILDIADRILTLDDGRLFETDTMLERMAAEVGALVAEMPGVFEWLAPDSPAPQAGAAAHAAFHQRFTRATEALAVRVSDHVRLRLRPALARRADALQQLLAVVRGFESLLGEFATHLHAAPPGLQQRPGDSLRQALEAVLLTTADVLRSHDHEDLAILAQITSDRSETMKRVRDTLLGDGATLARDEAHRTTLFALTNDFARLIYLLAQVAHFLAAMRVR